MFKGLMKFVREEIDSFRGNSSEGDALDGAFEPGGELDEAAAYALILTELGMADGNFDAKERAVVADALKELFPARAKEVPGIIKAAENLVNSFRGSASVIARIRREYSAEDKAKLFALIDKVIAADNHQDEIELYLRDKFHSLLE
jgi:uncharacterized tellurite resistance protein B-like protein